jgi:hypothetical protein
MSGVGHAIGKVFKGVVGIIKKIWKPLLIAVAIYFTAGAAAAYFGAAEGATAFAGAEAAVTGTEAAVGAGAAAEAGTAAAVGAGAAEGGAAIAADIGAGAATDAAAGMTIGDAATGAVADAGLGAGGAGAGAAGSAIGDGTIMGGAGPAADLTESAASGAYPSLSLGQGADLTQTAASGGIGSSAPGQTSSWWQSSLDTAGKVMKTPGVLQMLSSGINAYQQGQLYNQNLKWMAAHAPGQIQGGVPQGIFGGFAQHGAAGTNPNVAGENVAAHGRVARVNTNSAQPDLPGGITADPRSLPGMNQSAATAPYPGYGTPGYGQQSPRSGPPPISQQLAERDPYQQAGILGGGEMPYVESPYDQSVV